MFQYSLLECCCKCAAWSTETLIRHMGLPLCKRITHGEFPLANGILSLKTSNNNLKIIVIRCSWTWQVVSNGLLVLKNRHPEKVSLIRHLKPWCTLYHLQGVHYYTNICLILSALRASETSHMPTEIVPNIRHGSTQMIWNEIGCCNSICRHLQYLAHIRHLGPWLAPKWLRNRDFRKILAGNAISVGFSML